MLFLFVHNNTADFFVCVLQKIEYFGGICNWESLLV
jgi:hypothetical protein